jgi:hypothetical protein
VNGAVISHEKLKAIYLTTAQNNSEWTLGIARNQIFLTSQSRNRMEPIAIDEKRNPFNAFALPLRRRGRPVKNGDKFRLLYYEQAIRS